VGAAKGNVYDFFIDDFCKKFKLEIVKTYNSIKILEDEGLYVLSEAAERNRE
jgi:hypothetical protein